MTKSRRVPNYVAGICVSIVAIAPLAILAVMTAGPNPGRVSLILLAGLWWRWGGDILEDLIEDIQNDNYQFWRIPK